ncbi:hypothetical protein Tco_1291232, partial [Tanacetum coccineum]
SSASSPKSSSGKNKGLIAESYKWNEEEVSSDENEAIKVKALMTLANEERVSVSKENASNSEWVKCISEQIPTQKKKILGIDQLTEDTSSFGPKDPVFVKSSADNSVVSINGSNKPKLSEAEDSTLSNHDTGKSVAPLSPVEKLAGAKRDPEQKTMKSNLNSNPTFKAKTLKGITLKEASSAPTKDNKKGSSALKTSSAPIGKLKNVKVEDGPPLAITSQHHTGQGESSLRSTPSRPVIPFPSCIPCRYNDHQSDDCVYYPRCELCGSYDHDTQNHNKIISLRRGIKPRNPQHVTKHYETCCSNAYTITGHIDIEWFRKREAKKAGVNKTTSSNVQR